jgi:DNA primase
MKQAQEIIAQAKGSVRLEDEVRRRGVALSGHGKRLEGHCPLPGHEDSTPSFNVYTQTQRFHCFGCDNGGDVLDFVQLMDGCSLPEACARCLREPFVPSIASREGSGAPQPGPGRARLERVAPPRAQAGEGLYARNEEHTPILTAAMTYYHRALFSAPFALDYLASRGTSLRTAKRCMLGYDDGGFRLQLMGKPHLWQAARAAGLLTARGRDWLSGRLIIPEIAGGRCTWLIGRVLPTPVPQQVCLANKKYLGLPLPKPLLGYGRALALLSAGRQVDMLGIHVVEGALDYVIALEWQLPFYTVSLLGTHTSREHTEALLTLHVRSGGLPFLVNLDGDDRGGVGTLQLLSALQGYPALVTPALQSGKDLGKLAEVTGGYSQFAHALGALGEGGEWL